MYLRRLWPSLVWALAILFLTGAPGSYFPTVISFWDWISPDKIVHIVIFGIQTILVLYAIRWQYLSKSKRLVCTVVILVIVTLFALLTEVLQKYVFIGRHGNVYDFIADFVGVVIGIVAYYLFKIKKKKVGN